jgi:hypothetical protein
MQTALLLVTTSWRIFVEKQAYRIRDPLTQYLL